MSDGGKESKGEKEEQVEIEGKSHSNKNRKEEWGETSKTKNQAEGFALFFGGLGKLVTNSGGRGTAKGKAMRL